MFDPKNEQGVVATFMMDARNAGWEIFEIGTAFPDAILTYNGEQWRVEFEYRSSNFIQHKHDIRDCDIIICWSNDYPECPIPVLSLKSGDWKTAVFTKPDPRDVEISYWRAKCKRLEDEVSRLTSRIKTVITQEERELIEQSHEESTERRRRILDYYTGNPTASYQQASDDLGIPSKASVYNDLRWLEKHGYVEVSRSNKSTRVSVIMCLSQSEASYQQTSTSQS